jgi:Putative transposase/Transposase zinc-binding domain
MPIDSSFKRFFRDTIPNWDHDGTPPNVRENLWKVIHCGTPVLGGDVYASRTEQKIVYHTCKSRFCPCCGARASDLWKDDLEATIPDMMYREINFTMPRIFWSLFEQNRELLNELPAVGAKAIAFWAKAEHGARVILMVVQQTYGGFLNFYPHLHCLASAGGLDETRLRWVPDLRFFEKRQKHGLMLAWRYALLAFIDAAIQTNRLKSVLCKDELVQILHTERQRDWHIYVGRQVRKGAVIEHIGRYIRKPPISQRRLRKLDDDRVEYVAKDTRNERMRPMTYTNREFLSLLLPHVADRYCNSMRYFGLLAPRSKGLLSVVFDLLKQKQKPKPVHTSWALSLERTFHNNPLIGRDGSVLQKVGYLQSVPATEPTVQ